MQYDKRKIAYEGMFETEFCKKYCKNIPRCEELGFLNYKSKLVNTILKEYYAVKLFKVDDKTIDNKILEGIIIVDNFVNSSNGAKNGP